MGSFFVGSVPHEARAVIAAALAPYRDLKGDARPEAYVGCSGNYAIDKLCAARGFKVHSNDVSLYSALIGFIATGRELFRPVVKDETLKPVLAKYGDSARESLAKVMFAMACGDYIGRKNDYERMMLDRYLQKASDFMDSTLEKFDKTDMLAFHAEDFFYGDFRDAIERARERDVIFAFPPTYRGGYEKLYKFVDSAFEYPRPEYRLFDPDKAAECFADFLTRKQCMIYTDKRHAQLERWLAGAIRLGGGKHEIFLYSSFRAGGRSSVFLDDLGGGEEAPRTALLPHGYEPRRADIPSIAIVPSNDVLHYKRLFMSSRVDYSKGEDLCVEFGLNGKAFGWASFSTMLGTRQPGCLFEVSDFVMDSGIRHLSKLLVKLLLSADTRRVITRRFFQSYSGIQTSVYTPKPVSMKYRGVFQLIERDEKARKLTYCGYFGDRSLGDIYREWWDKEYGGGAS